jgi:hypothetical protein
LRLGRSQTKCAAEAEGEKTVRASEHLRHFHKSEAERHDSKAELCDKVEAHHRRLSELHRALHKASGLEPHGQVAAEHDGLASRFNIMARSHRAAAARNRSDVEDCEKAIVSGDLAKANQLQPTRVSAVTPDNPHRAIPRYGQPQVPVTKVAPEVDSIIPPLDVLD